MSHLAQTSRVVPTSVVVSDWDWTAPTQAPEGEQRGEDPAGREHELYLHRTPGTLGGYDEGARRYQTRDHADQARLQLEAAARDRETVSGRSTVCGLAAGSRCDVIGHETLDDDYVVTEVMHELVIRRGVDGASGTYSNRFEALPASIPYRPLRETPPPLAEMDTATVVGSGETGHLHVDEHGRIKVQFHWDRHGASDEHSSCWLRVMQAWAGAGRGAHWIPRIGDEVVVKYLRGDPDRPIVIGSVFNGDCPSHTETPARKTVSGIVTRSLGQAEGHHHLLFDDEPGSEAIDVHAQGDLRETVCRDHRTTVTRDQTTTVSGNQTLLVAQDRMHTVEQNETIEVQQDRMTTIHQNDTETVLQNQDVTVEQNRTLTVQGTHATTVTEAATETYLATRTVDVTDSETIGVHGDRTLTVDGTFTIQVGSGCELRLTPEGQGTLTLSQEFLIEVGET